MHESSFDQLSLLGGGDAVVGDVSTDPREAGDGGERAVGLEIFELSCYT
jgi:hypothetical protein